MNENEKKEFEKELKKLNRLLEKAKLKLLMEVGGLNEKERNQLLNNEIYKKIIEHTNGASFEIVEGNKVKIYKNGRVAEVKSIYDFA